MGLFDNYPNAVINAIQQRGGSGKCPMCTENKWVLHEVPGAVPVYEAKGDNMGKIVSGGTTMPLAVMICSKCGFTSFYSLGALGLIRKPGQEGQPDGTTTPSAPNNGEQNSGNQ